MSRSITEAWTSIRRELPGVLALVAAIWAVYFLQDTLDLHRFALVPRRSSGLPGIIAMPFLHADLQHLTSNSTPLLVLLVLLAGARARTWQIVGLILVLSGLGLWLSGASNSRYVGASMLVFGLIAFLILSGLRERRLVPMAIALVVGVVYGTTALTGLLPLRAEISEYAHLVGAAAGALVAVWMPRAAHDDDRGNSPGRALPRPNRK